MAIKLTPITRTSDDPNIHTKGSFQQGGTALFFFSFPDIEGTLFDPSDIDVTILDTDGSTVVETFDSADRISLGEYVIEWDIPATQAPGLYTIQIDYVVETGSGPTTQTFFENFVVGESSSVDVLNIQELAFRNFVESLIGYAQRIPVFHEIGRLNNARTIATFSFPRWNQPSGTRVFVNGELRESGHEVNFLRGRIEFDNALSSIDETQASYTFRWFKTDEIDSFVLEALSFFNSYAPHSAYVVTNLPPRYGIAVSLQASVFAIRRIMMDLHFQEPAKVFGGMDRADKLINSFETLKKDIEEDLKGLYGEKKKQPYAGLTKTVTVPEFTLPGGRCLAASSLLVFRVKMPIIASYTTPISTLYTKKYAHDVSLLDCQIASIECVYNRFKRGETIEVLSDKNGILSFEPVSQIWASGTKPLLRIEDEYDNFVEVSDEHIMFVDDEEIPARDVKIGDTLTVNLFDGVRNSKVVQITDVEETQTFDIEVPSTENLFVNNVKCHNSRWFRYLFKGSMVLFPLVLQGLWAVSQII